MSYLLHGWGNARVWLSVAAWLSAVAGAAFLYRDGAGLDAPAVAQVREYRIASIDAGRLAALHVREGQRVARGQVVARLDTTIIEKEIAVAEARLRQFGSEVGAAAVSLDASAFQTERSFQAEKEAADVELEAARGTFARESAELAKLADEALRQRDLVRRGLAKADRLDELELRRAALAESVNTWPRRIAALEARSRAAAARHVEWRKARPGDPVGAVRKTQLQPLEDRIAEQRELLSLLRARLNNAVLRSSADAYVTAILARAGDVLRAGDPVAVMTEAAPRHIVAYVEERRDPAPQPGARVIARRRAGNRDAITARVAAVGGAVSQLPPRFWKVPQIASWGREVYIELPEGVSLDPGETLDVKFLRGAPLAQSARNRNPPAPGELRN